MLSLVLPLLCALLLLLLFALSTDFFPLGLTWCDPLPSRASHPPVTVVGEQGPGFLQAGSETGKLLHEGTMPDGLLGLNPGWLDCDVVHLPTRV